MNLPEDFDFTQSNLQDYVDCPYRFYLRYFLRTRWPALVVDDAVDFELRGQTGARFHRLIQQFLLGVPEDRLDDLTAADPNPDVAIWWAAFLLNVPPWLEGARLVETILSTSLVGHRLIAKYDLVLVSDDNKLTIFDWKTSQKRARKDWLLERIQTRLYRFVLTQAGSNLTGNSPIDPEQVSMNYWFAPHPETPLTLPYHQAAYDADSTFLTELINEILEKDEEAFFKTNDLNKCRYCVYRSHCDRGTEAGDLDSFENFSVDPEDFELDIEFEEIAEIKF